MKKKEPYVNWFHCVGNAVLEDKFGELVVFEVSETPAFLSTWTLEEKFIEFEKWFRKNFIKDDEFFYDFSDWENEFDLELELTDHTFDTDAIVRETWGLNLSEVEMQQLVTRLDSDAECQWKPDEGRIDVEEIEKDLDFQSLTDIQEALNLMQSHLNTIQTALPKSLGHNRPPDEFSLSEEDFVVASTLVQDVSELDEATSSKSKEVLRRLALKLMAIAKAGLKYFGKTADAMIQSFATTLGKTGCVALVAYIAASGLTEIADLIFKFLDKIIG